MGSVIRGPGRPFVYEKDGEAYPSVTEILSERFGGTENLPHDVREKIESAARVGTAVHLYIEHTVHGDRFEPSGLSESELKQFENCCEHFHTFARVHKPTFIATEQPFFYKDTRVAFAGTIDATAIIDGVRYVIDFKTSSSISKKHYLQNAAYSYGITEGSPMPIAICHLPKSDGEHSLYRVENGELLHELAHEFLCHAQSLRPSKHISNLLRANTAAEKKRAA